MIRLAISPSLFLRSLAPQTCHTSLTHTCISLRTQVHYIDIREARARTCLLLALTFDPRLVQGVALLPPHLSSLAKRMPPPSPASPSAARGDPQAAAASELQHHRWYTINTLSQPPADSGMWQLPPGYLARVLLPRGMTRRPASSSFRQPSPTSSRGRDAQAIASPPPARSPSSRAVMSARSPSPQRLPVSRQSPSRPGTGGMARGGSSPQNFQAPYSPSRSSAMRSPSRMGSPLRASVSSPQGGRPTSSPQRLHSSGRERGVLSPPPIHPQQQGGAQVAYISHSRESSAPPSPSKKVIPTYADFLFPDCPSNPCPCPFL